MRGRRSEQRICPGIGLVIFNTVLTLSVSTFVFSAIFFRAERDALRMFPGMLPQRQEVQSNKRMPNQYIPMMLMLIYSKELIRQKFQQFIFG